MIGERPIVRHPAEEDEYFFGEGCHILEIWNREEDTQVSVVRARVRPGVTTRLHRLHGTVERYLILTGYGRVEIGELPAEVVAPGDLVYIPAHCPQRITNPGSDDLVFLAICTPRFESVVYEDIQPGERSGEAPFMANIRIKRKHHLGLETARIEVEKIAESLKSELQANYHWKDNQLLFERSGASGVIAVGEDFIDVDVKLGMALSLLKGKIEGDINDKLNEALG